MKTPAISGAPAPAKFVWPFASSSGAPLPAKTRAESRARLPRPTKAFFEEATALAPAPRPEDPSDAAKFVAALIAPPPAAAAPKTAPARVVLDPAATITDVSPNCPYAAGSRAANTWRFIAAAKTIGEYRASIKGEDFVTPDYITDAARDGYIVITPNPYAAIPGHRLAPKPRGPRNVPAAPKDKKPSAPSEEVL